MKRWTLTFTIIFLSISAWSQCPTEDIVMHTQQDIDNFAVNYPGCTEMLNNISIGVGWAATITSLNGLSQLTSISGQLRIDNTDLVNLMGLENLQSIGGLEMRDNYDLTSLTGLDNLNSINDVRILKSSLTSLTGLENLTTIGGDFVIQQNGYLTSLTGLDNITSVGGKLQFLANRSLLNMTGLENLTLVGGALTITGVYPYIGNASPSHVDLVSVAELENLTSVGHLSINGTTVLTNLTGLENVSITGGLSIKENDALSDLTALSNITTLGGNLRITDNDVLADLAIFENLTAIDGFLWIEDNAILTDLTVFENLTAIDGELRIYNNPALSSLMGLENIDHTTISDLEITFNPNLAICDFPNICTYLENGGTVDIQNNSFGCANQVEVEQACMDIPPSDCPLGDVILSTQSQVDAFVANYPNCTTINGNLTIQDDVTDLTDLSALTTITGNLFIHFTQSLTSLAGLEQIDSIGGSLQFDALWSGATLDISALDHPIEIGVGIFIGDVYPGAITPCTIQPICDVYNENPNNVESTYGICLWELQTTCNPPTGDCPPDDLYIENYGDILFFITYYPNCTTINGNLTFDAGLLGNQIDVTTDFANLQRINGDLSIWDTEIIGAFTALDTIIGGIGVSGNSPDGLDAELHADFPVLKYVGGGIGAGGSESGYIAPGIFPVLERIDGGLGSCYQWGNPFPLTDFPSLKYIGGNITVDYPKISGLNAVDTIAGDIHFQSCVYNQISVQITGLNQLKYVGGNVIFNDTHYSINLSGMTALNTIGGNLSFDGLWPASVNGLEQLKYIGGDLDIQRAEELTNLDFLSMLESVGGDVILNNNYQLNNIDGLNHAVSIGGQLDISENQQLSQCAVQAVCDHLNNSEPATIMSNMSGCDSVQEVQTACGGALSDCPEGDVSIYCQSQMDAFVAQYPNCTEINGNFRLYGDNIDEWYNFGCPISVNLPNLTRVNGTLGLGTSVSGLGNLQYVGGISVGPTGSATLTSLDTVAGDVLATSDVDDMYYDVYFPSCPQLKYIGGDLVISTYYGSFNSNRFPELEYVGGDISFSPGWTNINTANLSGMNNLRYVGGRISLGDGNISGFNALDTIMEGLSFGSAYYDPPVSVNITGLNQLKYIGGHFTLEDRLFGPTCVMDLSGLQELNYIGGDFQYIGQSAGNIDGCNSALDSINGMDKLKYVGGSLRIINNDLLHLDFLNQLETVGGDLELTNNDLGNIEGLNNMVDVSGEVIITQNSALSQCAVQAVCDHITDGNPTMIANNLSGCNSESEVETACQLLFPVEMAAPLRVYLNDKTAILQWRTATETNNKGFEIQRSKDGIEWERIGWQAGQGNTTTPQTYSYTDQNPFFGTSYYRLKQVDFSGDTEYSNTVSLRYIRNGVTVYPNPVKERLNLHTAYGTIQQIAIYDSRGKQITQITDSDNSIDVSALPKGIYMIKITLDEEDFYEKIIVE